MVVSLASRKVTRGGGLVGAFADRLIQLRQKAGLTRAELAAKAGLHRMHVVKLEKGEREPSWATVQALCRALGVSCSEFEGRKGK